MKITKYIHSLVLVEEDGQKILFDVGPFSFIEGKVKPEQFTGINAILITHKHGDHLDPAAIKTILRNNSGLRIITNQDTADVLKAEGIKSEILETGETNIGNVSVKAFPAVHGPIPFPAPTNTAYILNDKFVHPGDSLDSVIFEHKVDAIALPIAGPWLKWIEALDFTDKYKPKKIIPVHDGHIKDFFSKNHYGVWQEIVSQKGMEFAALLNPGDSIEI